MKQSISTFVFLFFVSFQLLAQTPQLINFQAVARKINGDPNPSVSVQVQFIIRQNDPNNGTIIYNSGAHNYQTDNCGMFTAKIGQDNSADFALINWANGTKFLDVKADGVSIGNQQMVSVPYALYAEKTNLQAGNGISVSGNTISNTGDNDNNSTNEIQTLSINGNQLSISGNGGNTVPLPIPPTYVPDIAIFEERRDNNMTSAITAVNDAFNLRKLETVVKSSPNVSLDGNSGQMTFLPGSYLITASAPVVGGAHHKLCLRTSNDEIKIRGTSESSNNNDLTGSRSFIVGVLNVPADGTVFKLSHYVTSGGGIAKTLGQPLGQVPGQEVYAQIMIQKIQ